MHWKYLHQGLVSSIPQLRQVLLDNRQVRDQALFFTPRSPLDLTSQEVALDPVALSRALERLQIAHQKQQDVLVFGDYDADGICATSVMWLGLHSCGFKARPFIPHRTKHGYGLSQKALLEIIEVKKPDLIVTVDNGAVAIDQIEWLQTQHIEVIVTDHHQPESVLGEPVLPAAVSVVHTTQLCGTTVAWMLVKELAQKWPKATAVLQQTLDLCGIATIADQVILTDANRSFAQFGVGAVRKTERPGLRALCRSAEVELAQASVSTINYVLAPRINALGRLDHGLDALRLLCTTNSARADSLAHMLSDTNARRQSLTTDMLLHAQKQADSWQNEHLIFVASTEFHEGVIGLLAGRLCEQYHKPAIVVAIGSETAKASARSIAGVNIVDLVRQVRADLLELGGHPMAAGFGMRTQNVSAVAQRLQQLGREQIASSLLTPSLEIECVVDVAVWTEHLSEMLAAFEPFGQGNPQPVLAFTQMEVLQAKTIGQEKQHLKLLLSQFSSVSSPPVEAVGWRMAHLADALRNQVVAVAGVAELNNWKGRKSLQLVVKDVHLEESESRK